jgi:hypothetical protein
MSRNNRIFYATQAIALKPQNDTGSAVFSDWYYPRGVQSAGLNTTFTLEQVFQLGQIELYENVEDVPEVEVTINKVVDGTPSLYTMCMCGDGGLTTALKKELPAIANNRVNFRLGIYSDENSSATGTPLNYVDCSGMYLSSVSYTLPVDGNITEDVTLVGNNKYWNSGTIFTGDQNVPTSGFFDGSYTGDMTAPSIGRRYKFNLTNSTLPTNTAKRGHIPTPSGRSSPYLQNISVSMDLGREAINELGSMAPYYRYVTFPVEVTSEFEIIADQGDLMNAKDFDGEIGCGVSYRNLDDHPIKIAICGSGDSDIYTIDLGSKNKLTSVNYAGGEAGGDNATLTYSYQSFNKFVVDASGSFASTSRITIS